MTIPEKYPLITERSFATYDFLDIIEGTGIAKFNGYSTNLSGSGIAYNLEKTSIGSSQTVTIVGAATTFNFDTNTFNLPRIIEGRGTVRFSIWESTSVSGTGWFELTLKKISDSTTNIVTSFSPIFTFSAGTGRGFTIPLTIPRTYFKIGDKLRLTVDLKMTGSGNSVEIGHDPLGRAGTNLPIASQPSTFDVLIPFKVNIE